MKACHQRRFAYISGPPVIGWEGMDHAKAFLEAPIASHPDGQESNGCYPPSIVIASAVKLDSDDSMILARMPPAIPDIEDKSSSEQPSSSAYRKTIEIEDNPGSSDESSILSSADGSMVNKKKRSTSCPDSDIDEVACSKKVPIFAKRSRRNAIVPNGNDAEIVQDVSLQFHMESVCFSPHKIKDKHCQISPLDKVDHSHEIKNSDFDSDCTSSSQSSSSEEKIN